MARGNARRPARDGGLGAGPGIAGLILVMWVVRIECQDQKRTLRLAASRTYTVGRGPRADIRVPDRTISRQHCMLAPHEGAWRAVDLGSKSGLSVNGEACRDRVLADHDVVELSSHTRLRVFRHEEAQAHPEAGARRRRRPAGVLLLLLAVAAIGGYLYRAELSALIEGHRASTSRFEELDDDSAAAALYRLAERPDPEAFDDLLALDAALGRLDERTPRAGLRVLKVGRALLHALTGAARAGDDRAFRALCERTDRPGVVPALLGLNAAGVDHVLDETAAGRLAAHRVAAELEHVADPAAFPRLRAVAFDAAAAPVLRDRALAALAARAADVPETDLLALVERHRERPLDHGAEMVAARAAGLLARRDPEKYGALQREYRDLQQRRHGGRQ
jgi:hypothetical protein